MPGSRIMPIESHTDNRAKTVDPAACVPGSDPGLARRLGLFDATMIVMGGIVGAGIFVNPSLVARQVHTPVLVLGAWIIGGAVALLGALVYAELAALCPRAGGQYAYLRDAYHPMVAFLYGWTVLLVVHTGAMAGVAIIFGNYFCQLTGIHARAEIIAVAALGVLTIINCLGVRAGSNLQSGLMLAKIGAIGILVGIGLFVSPGVAAAGSSVVEDRASQGGSGALSGLVVAMVPVLFAYSGWQTASFVTAEMRNPARDLPRGLLIGVAGVIVLYVAVTLVCLRTLGVAGLAGTMTPASDVMRRALGEPGARLIALGIAVSTIGYVSQCLLTAPRVYHAMARDGVLLRSVGWLHPRSGAPVIAIVLQGVWTAVIALSGKYSQILNYVVATAMLFSGLTGAALLVFRWRARRGTLGEGDDNYVRVPGHPVTTLVFVLICWTLSLTTVIKSPRDAGLGLAILGIGALVYLVRQRR